MAKHHDDTSVETEGFGDNDEGKFKKDQDDNSGQGKSQVSGQGYFVKWY